MNTTDYDRQAAKNYFFDLLSNGSRMDEHGGEETVDGPLDPKFWEFLALDLTRDHCEWLAETLSQRLREDHEPFQVLYANTPEGGKFECVRGWFLGTARVEESGEAGNGGDDVVTENGNSEVHDLTVWEWSKADAEAEDWLHEREAATVGDVEWMEVKASLAEGATVWEWTKYDSEAEPEVENHNAIKTKWGRMLDTMVVDGEGH